MIERSKTDADGEGAEIAIPRGRSEATCPVVALQSWLAAAQIIAGPLFRKVNRGGKVEAVRLTADGVRQPLLKRANASRLSGRPIAPALASLGLQALADLQARMLSAGQRPRLALSRMVVSAAPLWLLDEPTLGVDTVNVAAFGAIIAIHRAAGGVVVAATHLPLPLPEAAMLRLGEAA